MKKALTVLKYIWYSLMGIGELVFTMFALYSVFFEMSGDTIVEMFSSTLIFSVMFVSFLLLLLIDIFAIIRLAAKKRYSFISTRLMKLFVASGGLGAGLYLDDDSGVEVYAVMIVLCVAFGLAAFFFGRYAERISPREGTKFYDANAAAGDRIGSQNSDKAEWAWEPAAREFFHGEVERNAVSNADAQKIQTYASMSIACFLCWLLRSENLKESFQESLSPNLVNKIIKQQESPLVLLEHTGGVLSREMIYEGILPFFDSYYWGVGDKKFFTHDLPGYRFDYFKVFGDNKNFYVNDFSWEKQLELEKLLDRQLEYFNFLQKRYRFLFFRKFKSRLFGITMEVQFSLFGGRKYSEKCFQQIENPSEELVEKMCDRLNEYYEAAGKAPLSNKKEVFNMFDECTAYIYSPVEDVIAYSIVGIGELKYGKGCGFTVKGDYVSKVVDAKKIEEPWSEAFERNRRMGELSNEGERPMSIVPYDLGGSQLSDNTILAPNLVADFKDECDRRIICLIKQSVDNISYSCEPIYKNGSMAGVKMLAKTAKGKKLFEDEIIVK